ncbi:sequestosome-1 [Halyomorpha halys]|uniref:sequestosome-1 n=1 Tax=Halyomorpha halys TaxID=286706 RepID=UPI0006D5190F|nr:sequestosome-1-like [Halyomorpha halys]
MSMSMQYKIHLAIPGAEETRCIEIISLYQYHYDYLKHKIASSFPILNHHDFSLYWIDEEGDKIKLDSDDDLRVVVNRNVFNPMKKLYVTLKGPQGNFTNNLNNSRTIDHVMNILKDTRPIHTGVHCDGCQQNPLRGFRYKCLVCPDYDLCINCETSGNMHSHHPMARIPVPLNHENPFGK